MYICYQPTQDSTTTNPNHAGNQNPKLHVMCVSGWESWFFNQISSFLGQKAAKLVGDFHLVDQEIDVDLA
jgi:hypothetical protein